MTNKPQIAQWLDEVQFLAHFGTVQCKFRVSRQPSVWQFRNPGLFCFVVLPCSKAWNPLHMASGQAKREWKRHTRF